MKSTNDRDFSKNGFYCNDLMLKTVFIVMILKIKQYKQDNFVNFRRVKVWNVPGLRWSTQYIFSANPTVILINSLRLLSFEKNQARFDRRVWYKYTRFAHVFCHSSRSQ